MSTKTDGVSTTLDASGSIVCINNVRRDESGDNIGGLLHLDIECLDWLVDAIRDWLSDLLNREPPVVKERQQYFTCSKVKVSFSGSDYFPRLTIGVFRAEGSPYHPTEIESMYPEIGQELLMQLKAISQGARPRSQYAKTDLDWLFSTECPLCGEKAGWNGQVENVSGDITLVMACPHCRNSFGWLAGNQQQQLRTTVPDFQPGRESPGPRVLPPATARSESSDPLQLTHAIRDSFRDALLYCCDWLMTEPVCDQIPLVFRSPQLIEVAGAVFPDRFCSLYGVRATSDKATQPDRFSDFLLARKSLIRSTCIDDDQVSSELRREHSLLVIDMNVVSHDEMAQSETDGYVDSFDLPPWDTWVGMDGRLLVSWVPAWVAARMDNAISFESHGAYSWVRVNHDDRMEFVSWD